MDTVRVAFVRGGDWVAMYVQGQKVLEGHSLREEDVIEALLKPSPYTPEVASFDRSLWEGEEAHREGEPFPDAIADYPEGALR